jgi:hypothetical protein
MAQKSCNSHSGWVKQEYWLVIFNTYLFSMPQIVTRTRLKVTLYVHCLSCHLILPYMLSYSKLFLYFYWIYHSCFGIQSRPGWWWKQKNIFPSPRIEPDFSFIQYKDSNLPDLPVPIQSTPLYYKIGQITYTIHVFKTKILVVGVIVRLEN